MADETEVKKAKTVRPGFNDKDEAYAGVDPASGIRMAVTFFGLRDEFGEEKGREMYRRVAGIRNGSVFFNPNTEPTDYHPNLPIHNLSPELRAEVDNILSGKE